MIIGISGPMGAGKSTVAQMLVDRYKDKLSCAIVPFAGVLKNIAINCGWNHKKDKKGRKFLQKLGYIVREYVAEDAWIELWARSMDTLIEKPKIIIVDDLRFWNEFYYLRERGAIILSVRGRNEPWLPRILRDTSEKYFDSLFYDYRINNTGTLEDLCNKVNGLNL